MQHCCSAGFLGIIGEINERNPDLAVVPDDRITEAPLFPVIRRFRLVSNECMAQHLYQIGF